MSSVVKINFSKKDLSKREQPKTVSVRCLGDMETAVPRYHFQIENGVTVRDPDGLVFPDEAGAKRHAEYLASRMKAERRLSSLTVQVSDEDGRHLFEVRP